VNFVKEIADWTFTRIFERGLTRALACAIFSPLQGLQTSNALTALRMPIEV
jgi:hypothetical protein